MKIISDKKEPLYMIGVAARLLSVHPQTLRLYEREGLVKPKRINRQRLYSQDDIERLGLIISLTRDLGVNRSAVDIILRMRHRIQCMREEMEGMFELLEDDQRRRFKRRLEKILSEE
jgi:MerR family transcriptional regulator/heat shock protein HspR